MTTQRIVITIQREGAPALQITMPACEGFELTGQPIYKPAHLGFRGGADEVVDYVALSISGIARYGDGEDYCYEIRRLDDCGCPSPCKDHR